MSEIACAHRHLLAMIEREEGAEMAVRRAEKALERAREDRNLAEGDYESLIFGGGPEAQ